MNQQASNEFITLERQLIIYLMVNKVPRLRIVSEGRTKKKFVFDKEAAKPFVEKWQSSEPIPIDDLKELFQVEVTFNSLIHDEI